MTQLFLTRGQYDALIRECSGWMSLRWTEYAKSWSIGGVTVRGSVSAIENLREQVRYCRAT